MNRDFWKGKRVLLTGHTGFKGSWMALWLQDAGCSLTGYALSPPTNPNLFEAAGVAAGIRSEIGDIRDLAKMLSVVRDCRPEIVIHMAAQSVVRTSYQDPMETYDSNVMGTVKVLEVVRTVGGVRSVVVVTSDKCYENKEWIWGYREEDHLGGYDPYSNSKGCAELVTAAYRSSFFNPLDLRKHGVAIATARAGNVIGGGDWTADQLVPDIMRSIANGSAVDIRNPRAVRPWQFVLEPIDGYLTLAEYLWDARENYLPAWNFGPGSETAKSVEWMVERITCLWGDGAKWVHDQGEHPHEAGYLKLDSSRANTVLKWSPKLRLGTALEWVVEWYRAYQRSEDMRHLTIQQIRRFQECPVGDC